MKIRKVVFPVSGFGTRFLPVTKAIPKELLPIGDTTLFQSSSLRLTTSDTCKLLLINNVNTY